MESETKDPDHAENDRSACESSEESHSAVIAKESGIPFGKTPNPLAVSFNTVQFYVEHVDLFVFASLKHC